MSARTARPARAPAQNAPTPVGLNSRGVASKATEMAPVGADTGASGIAAEALHISHPALGNRPGRAPRWQHGRGPRPVPVACPDDDHSPRPTPSGRDGGGPDLSPAMIAALAGGVGAARLLRGMVEVVPPDDITAIVNTGDDTVLHGLHISPDLDTVMYTLADAINPETGWGLAGETWRVMESLRRLGGVTWFNLGDRDLATHLYRTQRLGEGATLGEVTAELALAWGVGVHLVPVTDDPLRTRLQLVEGPEVGFQDYFVRLHHDVAVESVRFEGDRSARPASGVLDTLARA